MYSQNNEELIITEHLKGTTGTFLDIGAYDGKTFSNSLRLVELGWKGVCVEASPINFVRLYELHSKNANIKLVQAAVTSGWHGELVSWYDSNGDGVSTTELSHKAKWEAGSNVRFREMFVYAMPLKALIDKFGKDFEFINIDVESTNLQLFRALALNISPVTKVICVEHDGHFNEMLDIAQEFGFKQVALNPENLILAR